MGILQGGFLLSLDLSEEDRFYDDKADVLESNGLAESSSFILRPNEEPSEQLLGFLRLLNLSGVCFSPLHGTLWPLNGCQCELLPSCVRHPSIHLPQARQNAQSFMASAKGGLGQVMHVSGPELGRCPHHQPCLDWLAIKWQAITKGGAGCGAL